VDFVDVGGGVSYSLTRSMDLFGSLLTMPWGTNGHALKTGVSLGINWTFRTPWARPQLAYQPGSNREGRRRLTSPHKCNVLIELSQGRPIFLTMALKRGSEWRLSKSGSIFKSVNLLERSS